MENPKGLLIERLQRDGRSQPKFHTTSSGPDHEPLFESDVLIDGEVLGSGSGGSKRDAERQAAAAALQALELDESAAGSGHDVADDGEADHADADTTDDLPFDGPWPLFEGVLAASITAANDRTDPELTGEAAIDAVHDLALRLYKGVLEDLGEVIELEDDED